MGNDLLDFDSSYVRKFLLHSLWKFKMIHNIPGPRPYMCHKIERNMLPLWCLQSSIIFVFKIHCVCVPDKFVWCVFINYLGWIPSCIKGGGIKIVLVVTLIFIIKLSLWLFYTSQKLFLSVFHRVILPYTGKKKNRKNHTGKIPAKRLFWGGVPYSNKVLTIKCFIILPTSIIPMAQWSINLWHSHYNEHFSNILSLSLWTNILSLSLWTLMHVFHLI